MRRENWIGAQSVLAAATIINAFDCSDSDGNATGVGFEREATSAERHYMADLIANNASPNQLESLLNLTKLALQKSVERRATVPM